MIDQETLLLRSVCNDEVETVRKILRDNPEMIHVVATDNTLLHLAAQKNSVSVMKTIIEMGLSIDILNKNLDGSPKEGIKYFSAVTPLGRAAMHKNYEAAQWLLEHGADPNSGVYEGRQPPIFDAIFSGSIEMVKLLVDHGADLNAAKAIVDPVMKAEMQGPPEMVAYIKKQMGLEDSTRQVGPASNDEEKSAFFQYLNECKGPFMKDAITPIVGEGVQILVSPSYEGKDHCTLITSGMRHHRMNVPPGQEKFAYAELVIDLPAGWPLSRKSFDNPKTAWPVKWLLKIAEYPLANNTWLGGQLTVISNEEPPRPLAPGLNFTGIFLAAGATLEPYARADGSTVIFYTVYPLYTEEIQFEKKYGPFELIQQFDRHNLDMTVDMNRPNVALKA